MTAPIAQDPLEAKSASTSVPAPEPSRLASSDPPIRSLPFKSPLVVLQTAMAVAALAFAVAALFLRAEAILVAGFLLIGAGGLFILFRSLDAQRHPPAEPADAATPAARNGSATCGERQ